MLHQQIETYSHASLHGSLASIFKVFEGRNFRLLWLGEGTSLLGDQFYLVGLGWLTMQLTNSSLALGAIRMAAAVPRAVLMLVGGAITDRFSPRSVMLVSNFLRAVITIILAALAFTGALQLWQLYVLAISFGIVDAFFYPAYGSIIPIIVDKQNLEAGNGIMYGTMQLRLLVGPAAAGFLIAKTDLSFAFAFDAATFIFASLTLILMHLQPGFKAAESRSGSGSPSGVHGINLGTSGSLLTEIHDGLEYVIRHPLLGALLGLVAAVHFAIDAPIFVGVNALASNRFIGAENLGLMLSAWGGGALFGALIAGVWRVKNRGRVVLGLAALLGILFITLGFLPNLVLVTIDLALMGLANGFWSVVGLAWVQKVVPDEFRGRAMSVVMLASAGIVPFSYALSGWLADLSLTLMFIIAGAVILSTVVSAGRNRALRAM